MVLILVCKENAKLHPVPYFLIKQRYIFTRTTRYYLIMLFIIKLRAQSNIET